jgi:hypothetical protein
MWKRILWDVLALILLFFAPWWVVFIVGVIGIVFFSWYLEIIFLGVLYDVFFGGVSGTWYYHLIHTTLFTTTLIFAEFIKTRVNTRFSK